MTPRQRALLVSLACAACAASPSRPDSQEGRSRPNVIVIITDDQGYGDLGAHGNSMIRTPHLDELHGESVRLTDFHVDPTCAPTRSALMTGRYSTRTGVWHTIMGRSLMDGGEETLAEVFRAGGYRTGMFGKWHLGDNYPCRPQDQGFDRVTWHRGGGVGQGPDFWGNDYFDDTYERDGELQAFSGYCTDVWFREARDFVAQSGDRPFFAYLSTNAPHGPYLVDPAYEKPYLQAGVPPTMARFYGMIENIDDNVGLLRKQLEDLGIADNTLIVFLTDNGTAAGHAPRGREPGEWSGFNAGMRGNKGSEYDGGHRVPCFFHWPDGGIDGGRDIDALTAHVDMLPTLMEVAGLALPVDRPLDGASLAAALTAKEEAPDGRVLFVHSQRIEHPVKWRKSAVMEKPWRLINGKELYDVDADPTQLEDLAADRPEIVARLTRAYDDWWESLEPVFDGKVRIGIGGPENPVRLMSHDWHEGTGGTPWHQNHVRKGAISTGTWALNVERSGRYEISLTRWPHHLERPMGVEHAEVTLTYGDGTIVHQATDVAAAEASAILTVNLPAGAVDLSTLLRRTDGQEHGSYYAAVRPVPTGTSSTEHR